MQKCEGSAGSAGGKGRDAPPGGKGKPKGKPKGKGRKGKPKHGTNGKILPLEFVAAMVGGACTPMEFMAVMAGDTGTKLALSLLKALKLPVSDKPNAKYDTHDMYRILLAVFSHENNQSSMDGVYRADRGPGGPKKLISRTRALEIIRGVRHDYMLKRCGNVVARSMARARRHGMLRRPIDAAIDMHDIPLYAKGLMKYAVYSKYKRGTKKFVRLATIHCVVAGQRLTLGVAVVRRGDETADVVERLLRGCRRRGIRVRSLAVDRGFHSVAVMRRAKKMGIPIVMPAVKLPRIKECVREYDAGERGAISEHTITSASGRTASYKLVIVRRQNRTKGATKEAQKAGKTAREGGPRFHLTNTTCSPTTMPDSWIDDDPDKVAEFYRVRWGIENSYKSYEQMRPRTTSRSYSVRLLLTIMPFVFYNIWTLGPASWRPAAPASTTGRRTAARRAR